MPRPIRPAPPAGGNAAAFPPRELDLAEEQSAVIRDLVEFYSDANSGFAPGEEALLDRAAAVLARARQPGRRP